MKYIVLIICLLVVGLLSLIYLPSYIVPSMPTSKPEAIAKKPKTELEVVKEKAVAGDAKAQFDLAGLYYFGNGVEQDLITAYAWQSIAATNGYEKAIHPLSSLPKLLSDESKTEVESLTEEMIKKNPKLLNKK